MIGRGCAGPPLATQAAGAGLPVVDHDITPARSGLNPEFGIRAASQAVRRVTPSRTKAAAAFYGEFCERGGSVAPAGEAESPAFNVVGKLKACVAEGISYNYPSAGEWSVDGGISVGGLDDVRVEIGAMALMVYCQAHSTREMEEIGRNVRVLPGTLGVATFGEGL